jgi:acyl carrier protein
MHTTLATLQTILIKDYQLAPEALTLGARLEDLGIDSLATAELLFSIEDSFHLVLPPEPMALATLGEVVDYIDHLVAKQAGISPAGTPHIGAAQAGAPQLS